jgi:hypothetical protein
LAWSFVRRLQITPATGHLFPDPDRAVGGTTASLSDMTIRCDYDQHALTAYLAALETSDLLDSWRSARPESSNQKIKIIPPNVGAACPRHPDRRPAREARRPARPGAPRPFRI